ncbi:hypothetical protein SADUNF_Sadunf11G0018400 [Salix dunnii]|uniref:Uncharacterized protein n=1 Tax=Salix dunnii TaxID=1413687 RepID=A0A835JPJ9_9ROSI|nr:hypothetical protein SADUNF_Sadunf11G0018400 [Salix dunnii]
MAYYSYSYDGDYQGGHYNGGYSVSPYYSSYDSSSDHDSVAYSSYNYNQHQGFSYDPPYYAAYDPVSSYSRTAYSESTFSEPMCIKYDPGHYYHEQTRFIVSYNDSEFNETDFEEYDPTPYDGGFDLAATYGKPLPPSAEICYPRSTPDPNVASLDGFSYGSIIAPYGKDEVNEPAAKPQGESKPISPPPIEAAPVPLEFSDGHGNSQEKLQKDEGSEERGADHPDPWPGYDTGIARGSSGDLGYEYGKQWPQVPSGYGLEAMDLCEGLFGYWPCLSRYARNNHDSQKAADCGSSDPCCGRWDDGGSGYGNQWKVTADYLFGSSNPYGERRDDGGGSSYGNVTYGYERHYQEEPLYYQQVKYVEDPW